MKRTYGFLIDASPAHGTQYVSVRIVCREDNSTHPLNCRSEGESSTWDDAPKHVDGLLLCDLGWHGHVSEWDGRAPEFIAHGVEYREPYSVDLNKAQKMAKTLKRINRQIERDGAHEPGDVLMSIATALKLDFFAMQTDQPGGSSWGYDSRVWHFDAPSRGRDKLRQEIAKATEAAAA